MQATEEASAHEGRQGRCGVNYTMRSSPFSLTPWVRALIIANAVIYLLGITVFTGQWFGQFMAFSVTEIGYRPWTFVTYMFMHGGFFHLLFNMLLLFFFGPAVEERLGGSSFALYYFTCGVGGAIFGVLLSFVGPVGPVVGASAAVLGVMLAFAMFWPDMPVYVFPLPVPVKVKWLVAFLVIMDLLFLRVNDGIAHFAHLGGFLFGFIYLKSEAHLTQRTQAIVRAQRSEWGSGPVVMKRPKPPRPKAPDQDVHTIYDDIDRILDKISQSGLDSLTPEERKLLDEGSRKLRKH